MSNTTTNKATRAIKTKKDSKSSDTINTVTSIYDLDNAIEEKEMSNNLLTPRNIEFIQRVIENTEKGIFDIKVAYREVYNCSLSTARINSSRLVQKNALVREAINEARKAQAENFILKREDAVNELYTDYQTCKAKGDYRTAQKNLELLSKICGWQETKLNFGGEVELKKSPLEELTRELFEGDDKC